MDLVRDDLKQLKYKGVQSMASIAAEVGLPESALVKLDANENVYGAHPRVLLAVAEASQKLAHIYPDPVQELTRGAIAEKAHPRDELRIEQVVAGAGSDDVLDVVLRLFCPQAIVVSTPTFGMYKFLGELAGAKVVDVPRVAPSFELDIAGIIAAFREHGAGMVFLASPNNPTGNAVPLSQVRRLCRECKGLILIDEAYGEFAYDVDALPNAHGDDAGDYGSAVQLLGEFSNLAVTRTFSKWAGLAGLRVGYLLSSPDIVAGMMAIKQPYNISIVAEAAACAALRERAPIMETVNALSVETARLFRLLSQFSLWLRPLPSSANFVLCAVTPEGTARTGITAEKAFQFLRKRGILVRYFGSQGGALESYFRISAGKPEHTQQLFAALRALELSVARAAGPSQPLAEWWKPDTILFDMDGVIVDVGDSYRQAILDTTASFGVPSSHGAIDAIKAAGDANNDWAVSLRLIAARLHSPPSLQEVTDRFEQFYQDGGLWKNESLLIQPSTFATLSTHHTLGIVTGRPRHPDAIRFLEINGILPFFEGCIVCMEDAPLKPSPQPVLRALSLAREHSARSGCRAVMIGDTPDDIMAAVGAGALPIGVIPPNPRDAKSIGESLFNAGAAFVLSDAAALQTFLLQTFV